MKPSRSALLMLSLLVALFLLGGSLAAKSRSDESSWRQVVLFSEILSLVVDNYVDPVETDELLGGAFEGMLAGLDAQGAYLTEEEVREWKRWDGSGLVGSGLAVLKAGRSLQVVAIEPGSAAELTDIEVGDRLRAVDGRDVRALSLGQAWRLLQGKAGDPVRLEVVHPSDSFKREEVEIARSKLQGPGYELGVERAVAVLHIDNLSLIDGAELKQELNDIDPRGLTGLLVDVRNVADIEPRDAMRLAGLFAEGAVLKLRDRSGRLVESLDLEDEGDGGSWQGSIAVLVNGATAGSGEALASLIRTQRTEAVILGEATYGLGAEATLYELDNGAGVLVSAQLWETADGAQWNGDGIEPDEVIHGKGDDFAAASADQLQQVLDHLEQLWGSGEAEERQAA